jgi:hypothetical protein
MDFAQSLRDMIGHMSAVNPKKVAIFAPIALWERHWAFAIEVAHREDRAGNLPLIIHCKKALESCPPNPSHLSWKCSQCVHQVKTSISQHFPKSAKHLFIGESDVNYAKARISVPSINNSAEMSSFKYDNFPFGSHVISHLISINRDRNLPDQIIRDVGSNLLINSIAMYESLNFLLPQDIEKIILWGGRRSSEAPIKFVAEKRELDLLFLEEGSSHDRYILTNEDPFVFDNFIKLVRNWEVDRILKGELDVMLEEGSNYYLDRRKGKNQEPSFVWFNKGAKPIPLIGNKEKRILAIFTSSDWEIAELGLATNSSISSEFANQYTSLTKILNDEFIKENFEIVVRWHPNHRISGLFEKQAISSVIDGSSEVTHFRYTDSFDSYQLVEMSDIVLVFNSTIGIEAAYLEKPTILVGNSNYAGLGSVYRPENMRELRNLLTGELGPLPNYGAILYGAYMKNRGTPLQTLSYKVNSYFIYDQRIQNTPFRVKMRFILGAIKRSCRNFWLNFVSNLTSKHLSFNRPHKK